MARRQCGHGDVRCERNAVAEGSDPDGVANPAARAELPSGGVVRRAVDSTNASVATGVGVRVPAGVADDGVPYTRHPQKAQYA